jgi:hypothetical protein
VLSLRKLPLSGPGPLVVHAEAQPEPLPIEEVETTNLLALIVPKPVRIRSGIHLHLDPTGQAIERDTLRIALRGEPASGDLGFGDLYRPYRGSRLCPFVMVLQNDRPLARQDRQGAE